MTKIVAVGAGHGINTPGKRSPADEREWSFNTVVAQSVIDNLNSYKGVKVIRLDDPSGKTDVPLRERTNKANKVGADVLVSCHHNASTGKWGSWTGTETYHYPGSTEGNKLAKAVHPHLVKAYGLRDRGVKNQNFHMLRESNMPAILTEGAFMDSTIDIKKMRDKNVLKSAGAGIAKGIAEYLGLKKGGSSPKPDNKDGVYKVQIGAFSSRDKANNLANKAKGKGFDVYVLKEGNMNKVQIGAYSKKSNADKQADKARKAGFDVYIASNPVSKPETPPGAVYKVGDKVVIRNSARNYATGEAIPSKYKGKQYTVQKVDKGRVLIKELLSWVRNKDINVSSKPPVRDIKVGDKVKIKTAASTYATGETIPSKYKGTTLTVQQVRKDRVLIKELYSWVRKRDIQ